MGRPEQLRLDARRRRGDSALGRLPGPWQWRAARSRTVGHERAHELDRCEHADGIVGLGDRQNRLGHERRGVRTVSIDTNTLLAPLNAKLEQAGKPTLSAEQAKSIAKDAATTAATRGRLDRDVFVTSIARNTQLEPSEVRSLFAGTIQQVEQKLGSLRQQAEDSAEQAAHATARAFWALFALSLTSLLGSVLGASTGVSRRQRAALPATSTEVPLARNRNEGPMVYP